MRSNRLQLNADKTDLIWCTSSRRQHQLPTGSLRLGGHDVIPSSSVRNLGVYIDADLSFRRHIDVVSSRCFAALRQLRNIRHHVSVPVMQSLATSLVLTRVDYCISVLYGLPASHLRRLQAVQNAAARIVFNLRRYDHVTDALICLHWLRIPERIRFKMAVLVYRALHGQGPSYLQHFVTASSTGRLRSASTRQLVVPRCQHVTIGGRSFPVAGAAIWNSLSTDVTSSPSLSSFRTHLKTSLFSLSFPGAVV
jgi:hypothetical protein